MDGFKGRFIEIKKAVDKKGVILYGSQNSTFPLSVTMKAPSYVVIHPTFGHLLKGFSYHLQCFCFFGSIPKIGLNFSYERVNLSVYKIQNGKIKIARERSMKKVLSTHLFVGKNLDEGTIALVKKYGFTEIELWGMPPHLEYHQKEKVRALASMFREEGLKIVSIHGPFYESIEKALKYEWFSLCDGNEIRRKKALEEMKRTMDVMDILGTNLLVVHCGSQGDTDSQESRGRMIASLQELDNYAGKRIFIAVENIMTDLSKTGVLIDMLKGFNEYVGICLDIGHANVNEDPIQAIKTCARKLLTTHISDNDGRKDLHLTPFEGQIPWGKVYKTLIEAGYKENFVFELRNYGDVESQLERVNEGFQLIVTRYSL